MNLLFLSMIYCFFLSQNIYSSDQPSAKKSGWSWPILRTIGIVKTKKEENSSIVIIQGLTKNLSDNSLRKSIAEDGFDHGHIDDHDVISVATEPNTPAHSVPSNQTSPTSSKKTILIVSDNNNTETHSPLQTTMILPAVISTDNQTTSSNLSSRDSNSSTTELIDNALTQEQLQKHLTLVHKKTAPTTKPGLPGRRLPLLNTSVFSDFESDCSQISDNGNSTTLKNLAKKSSQEIEQEQKVNSSRLYTLEIETPEEQSFSNDIKSLCGCCFKKKNPNQ